MLGKKVHVIAASSRRGAALADEEKFQLEILTKFKAIADFRRLNYSF